LCARTALFEHFLPQQVAAHIHLTAAGTPDLEYSSRSIGQTLWINTLNDSQLAIYVTNLILEISAHGSPDLRSKLAAEYAQSTVALFRCHQLLIRHKVDLAVRKADDPVVLPNTEIQPAAFFRGHAGYSHLRFSHSSIIASA
jgi:hypothetical protein